MNPEPHTARWKSAVNSTLFLMFGWILAFWPARSLEGESGVWWMSLAAIFCLVLTWSVAFLSGLAIFRRGSAEMYLPLIWTSGRVALVMGLVLVVKFWRPEIGVRQFYGWLIAFYLLLLAVETQQARSGRSNRGGSGGRAA